MDSIEEHSNDERQLLSIALLDENMGDDNKTLPTADNEKTKRTSNSDQKKIDIDEEQICSVCNGTWTYRSLKQHKKSKDHQLAKNENKAKTKQEKSTQPRSVASASPAPEKPKTLKKKYEIRKGSELQGQNLEYQNTLTAFLAVRYSLNNNHKDLEFSTNNLAWNKFGDIVIEEITGGTSCTTYAIQCQQIQSRNDISKSALIAEIGKFSFKKQCGILESFRKKNNYDTTYFVLYTVSNLIIDDNFHLVYDDSVLVNWSAKNKEIWNGRDVKVCKYKKQSLINTTDEPDNICIFKMIEGSDDVIDKDLSKFSLFINQHKTSTLKHLVKSTIENKFDTKIDISNDIIRYVSDYFKTDNMLVKSTYKLTKRDMLLKIAELLLSPFILFPDSAVQERVIKLWEDAVVKFDIIVIRNEYDIINKVYSSINNTLKSTFGCSIDSSAKFLKVEKERIKDESIKIEIFSNNSDKESKASLDYLYTVLWKNGLAPLVLTVNNETNLSLIIKIINFLDQENIRLKYILMGHNFKIPHSSLPVNLNIFFTLEDLKKMDEDFFKTVLKTIRIPILESNVSLGEIVKFNSDFPKKVKSDGFLNMCLQDFSFKNLFVPLTDDIVDNTLVFDDAFMEKFGKYFHRTDEASDAKCLSYVVSVKGTPVKFDIPPDI